MDAEALVDEELAGRGPRSSIHEDILGEEKNLDLRQPGIEDGQDEREDHDLARLLVEGAPCI